MKVSISIPDKMMKAIDEISDSLDFPNRSLVIRTAIKEYLDKNRKKLNE